MADEPTRENPSGPIGTEVLYENDQVRVWDMKVPPGGKKAWHHHKLDYVIINVTGGKIELENVAGPFHHRRRQSRRRDLARRRREARAAQPQRQALSKYSGRAEKARQVTLQRNNANRMSAKR